MAKVLIFCDFYSPGFKAGGPITTIRSATYRLRNDHRFQIVTRDRDLGDRTPYPCAPSHGRWTRVGDAEVLYLGPSDIGVLAYERLIRAEQPDLIYVNSFHSPSFALKPLIARRRVNPSLPLIVAPRGELAPSALDLKRWRKRLYRMAVTVTGLLDGAVVQASSADEAADIGRVLGNSLPIAVAPDMPTPIAPMPTRRNVKRAGSASLVFLGRISPMKNLDWLLGVLYPLEQIQLDVYGPTEDENYWAKCMRIARGSSALIRAHGPLRPGDVTSVLAEADALVLPSLGENFGQVVPEALAAGCPVLISDRTPWRAVADHKSGWYLPLAAAEWRSAIAELAGMDGMQHAHVRERARAHAESIDADVTVLEANKRLIATALETRVAAPR